MASTTSNSIPDSPEQGNCAEYLLSLVNDEIRRAAEVKMADGGGKQIHTAMHVLAADSSGIEIAEAGTDKMIRTRTRTDLRVPREFRAHDDVITALPWHPIRRILASACGDLCIRLWDLDSGEMLKEFYAPPLIGAQSLAFSPDGARLASAAAGNRTKIWDLKSL